MNEEIQKLISQYEEEEFPVAHLRYKGKSRKFVTWTITGERPALTANDEVLCSICSLDVDIFSESNYLDVEKFIKEVLQNNDWVWVEDSEEMYEDDTRLYHKT